MFDIFTYSDRIYINDYTYLYGYYIDIIFASLHSACFIILSINGQKEQTQQKKNGAPRPLVSFRLSTEMEICFPICLRSGLLHVLLPDRCQEVQYSWPHSFVGKSCRVEMVLLPIFSLPHMHSNVLFLSANCVEVRHSRSWNEATSRRRTSQMLRLIPLRPRKAWNRRWYHVGISTMWFCTCTEYEAQYQYMSHYMVRFIHI